MAEKKLKHGKNHGILKVMKKHGKIIEFLHEIALWMSISLKIYSLASLARQCIYKKKKKKKNLKISFSFLNRAIEIHLLFIIKHNFSYLFNYLCNISIFAFYIALYDKRKVGCHTLNIMEI